MSLKTAILSTTSLVFIASSASADVTAKDIWEDWQTYMTGFGYSVQADESMSSNRLTVTNLMMQAPMPEGEGAFSLTLDKVDFVENGDGTVTLVFPEVTPMTFTVDTPDSSRVNAKLDYTMQNMNMVASGDPSKVTYTYTADGIGIALNALDVDGEMFDADTLKAEFISKGVSGVSVMEPGALRKNTQSMTLGETEYTINFQDPDSSDSMVLNGTMGALTFSGEVNIPAEIDPENIAKAMADGFAVNFGFGYTQSNTEFAFTDGGDVFGGTNSAGSAQINVRMNKDQLEYTGTSKDISMNMAGGELPLPIVAQFGEIGFNLLMPVAKGEEETDFALGLTFGDFSTSEDLWSIIDAGKVLPRDPATVSFDLVGKAKMLFDLFDPEQMAAVENGDAMPAELNALTLRNLLVSVAGAKLSSTGDFTFDNTDLESFNGIPKPTGGIDLSLVGGNGLMDKLVEMGLLPQEQAMGARMMMGLFARPGEGEDSLTSKIEINEAGHILANGQRIQ